MILVQDGLLGRENARDNEAAKHTRKLRRSLPCTCPKYGTLRLDQHHIGKSSRSLYWVSILWRKEAVLDEIAKHTNNKAHDTANSYRSKVALVQVPSRRG